MSRIRAIVSSVKNYFYDRPKVMGRWTIVYCPDAIKTKVDRTNEDHCGPCGQYGIQTDPVVQPKDSKTAPTPLA